MITADDFRERGVALSERNANASRLMGETDVLVCEERRSMNQELALHLTDIRLLQTLRLLETALSDHPD
jgi:hypothetical protein